MTKPKKNDGQVPSTCNPEHLPLMQAPDDDQLSAVVTAYASDRFELADLLEAAADRIRRAECEQIAPWGKGKLASGEGSYMGSYGYSVTLGDDEAKEWRDAMALEEN